MSDNKHDVEERIRELRDELINSTGNGAEIMKICARSVELMESEYNAHINEFSSVAMIVYTFMKATAEYLNENKTVDENVILNMFDIFNFGVAYRESEDGEKDGNFVPYLEPRPSLKTMFKSDEDTEDVE